MFVLTCLGIIFLFIGGVLLLGGVIFLGFGRIDSRGWSIGLRKSSGMGREGGKGIGENIYMLTLRLLFLIFIKHGDVVLN